MTWLCNFRPCRWMFLFNVKRHHVGGGTGGLMGVYQCACCQRVSVGIARTQAEGPHWTRTIAS